MNAKAPKPIEQAAANIQAGRLPEARQQLIDFIKQSPGSEQAWLLLASISSDKAQMIDCLQRVLKINPANQQAARALAVAGGEEPGNRSGPVRPAAPMSSFKRKMPPASDQPVPPLPRWEAELNQDPADGSTNEPQAKPKEPINFHPSGASIMRKVSSAAPPPRLSEGDVISAFRGPINDNQPEYPAHGQVFQPEPVRQEEVLPEPAPASQKAYVPQPVLPAMEIRKRQEIRKANKQKRGKMTTWSVVAAIFLCLGALAITTYVVQQTVSIQGLLPTPKPGSFMEKIFYRFSPTQSLAQTFPPTWTPAPSPIPSATLTPNPTPTLEDTPIIIDEGIGIPTRPPDLVGYRAGNYAPDFGLNNAFDNSQVILYGISGSPVVLYFWNTACSVCQDDMQALQTIYIDNKLDGLRVLAINVGDNLGLVRSFTSSQFLTFNILMDSDASIRKLYGVNRFPSSFYIDRNGKIVSTFVGAAGENGFKTAVAGIMK